MLTTHVYYCMFFTLLLFSFFFFNDTATTEIYTLSLHDALPIFGVLIVVMEFSIGFLLFYERTRVSAIYLGIVFHRSEEHTSELQSRRDLVCRLLLEKKKKIEMLYLLC